MGFCYSLLFESNNLLKLVVYQEARLQAVLDEAPFCIMGAKLNYSYPLRPAGFINEVRARWQLRGHVPHEIGVALGYPLDDVSGYMGFLLPAMPRCVWMEGVWLYGGVEAPELCLQRCALPGACFSSTNEREGGSKRRIKKCRAS